MDINELQQRANELAAKRHKARENANRYAEKYVGEIETSPEWLDLWSTFEAYDREWTRCCRELHAARRALGIA